MSIFSNLGPNRYLCSVLEEMRAMLKLLDLNNIDKFKSVMALSIEEAQNLGNRMEAALEDAGDIESLLEKRSELKKEIRKLKLEKNRLHDNKDTDDE